MSCFKLPRGLCEHIDATSRGFWWGVAWEEMVKPKQWHWEDSLQRYRAVQPSLASPASRILNEPTSLSARIFKAV